MSMNIEELKNEDQAPRWLSSESLKILEAGYMLPGETPRKMWERVSRAAASYYTNPEHWFEKFFNAFWNNWLCGASPVLSNLGTNRGLPISCDGMTVGDSVDNIFKKNHELAILSKNGAGVSIYLGKIRGRGTPIKGIGSSDGVIPWARTFDTTTHAISQGNVRRGATALYLPIEHKDVDEFMIIRRASGDMNRRCLNVNNAVCISDNWMQEMLDGDEEKKRKWEELLKTRDELGEPYIFFTDAVNKDNPQCYKDKGLEVNCSNLCCLGADTLVLTSNGPVRIEDLVGKTIKIWDGLRWVDNSGFERKGEDVLIRIHLSDGSYVDSNSIHRWFVAKTYNDIRNNKYRETFTSNLKVGEYLEFHEAEAHGDTTTKAAYLKGFLIGDGTQTKGRPLLNVHSTKYMCINGLIDSANEIEPGEINTNADEVISFSEEITNPEQYGRQIFRKMKGLAVRKHELFKYSSEYKHDFPEEAFTWNKETKLKFLAGLLDSDGTRAKTCDQIQISSISKSFIDGLYYFIKTFGIRDVCVRKENTIGTKDVWRLTIGPYQGHILLKMLPSLRLKPSGFVPNRQTTGFRRIKNIEILNDKRPVFCTSVPTTGKFALANGIMTGNSEITLFSDETHTFVCCLSSLNLVKWDEWKDTDLVETSIRFLDAVMSEYIEKSEKVEGLECARRFAIKSRALGLGALGWHTLLQERNLPFDSIDSFQLNAEIFRTIRKKAEEESKRMAEELGEPEWCRGYNRRHTHLLAIAPTVSNSAISGGHSPGIEPIPANIYSVPSAKGTFIRHNPTFKRLLQSKEKDTLEVWDDINSHQGSVQHLDWLTDEEKQVFLTAREINQHVLVKQAAQRQRWIDQSQSLNLFFSKNSEEKYIHEVHTEAWKQGLKTLYYLRSEGTIRGDLASRSSDECAACEG